MLENRKKENIEMPTQCLELFLAYNGREMIVMLIKRVLDNKKCR